jgi:tetratricopeptide (TPR) repeat protein
MALARPREGAESESAPPWTRSRTRESESDADSESDSESETSGGPRRTSESLLLYLDATELDGTLAASWYGLGAAEQVGGLTDEAMESYRRAASLAPGEPMYRKALDALEARRTLATPGHG